MSEAETSRIPGLGVLPEFIIRAKTDWLTRIVDGELEKPDSKVDVDLIEECLDYINELNGIADLTDEELEIKRNALKRDCGANGEKRREHKITFRVFVAAAIVAVTLLFAGMVAAAFGYNVWSHILEAVKLPVGVSVEMDGITYIHAGKSVEYDSMDEFAESLARDENLYILYPGSLPEGIFIKEVMKLYSDNTEFIVMEFNDKLYGMEITLNQPDDIRLSVEYSEYKSHGMTFYIYTYTGEKYYSSFHNNNMTYYINAPDYDTVIFMIDNLKGN